MSAPGLDESGGPARGPRLAWLGSRWVVVPGTLAALTLAWLAYVGAHSHGHVEGRVVDAAGRPVSGATVVMYERGFVTHQERSRTTTGPDGVFRFDDNRSHSLQLEADVPGVGRSDRRVVRLWFAAQDAVIDEPLRVPAGKP